MPEYPERGIDEILEDLQRINQEYMEKIRSGFRNPDDFIKLSEIERMGQELSYKTRNLYLEETTRLLDDIDEEMLLRKKKTEYREKGINLTPSQLEARTIMTLNGAVRIVRRRLRPVDGASRELLLKAEGVKSIAPLDCYLGIDQLPFKLTPAVMVECAYWAQDQISFERAEEKLKKALHISVDDDTLRKAAGYIGKAVFEEDCRKAETAWKEFCLRPLPTAKKQKKGILYIEVDGCAVNTRIRDENGSTWRENKLGIFFSSDHIYQWRNGKGECCRRIEQKEYVSYIGSVSEFKKHVLAAALRNGYGAYEKVVLLSDGASWISNMKDELFGDDAIQILDFYHLCENVYSYGKARFRMDESRYVPWAKGVCERLRDGEWEDVLEDLDPDETYNNTVNLYHYISTNREHIDYPGYSRNGYFIGSGAVESSNKIIVQKRFKQAGMRWGVSTAQYLITLVAKKESGLWQSDVVKKTYEIFK